MNKTIGIIDENEVFKLAIKKYFKSKGINCITAKCFGELRNIPIISLLIINDHTNLAQEEIKKIVIDRYFKGVIILLSFKYIAPFLKYEGFYILPLPLDIQELNKIIEEANMLSEEAWQERMRNINPEYYELSQKIRKFICFLKNFSPNSRSQLKKIDDELRKIEETPLIRHSKLRASFIEVRKKFYELVDNTLFRKEKEVLLNELINILEHIS